MKNIDLSQLSTEDLEQLLAEKRAADQAKANDRRAAYESLRTEVIEKIRKEAGSAIAVMRAFYELVYNETTAFREIMKEYGALRTDEQIGYVINDEVFRIEVKGNKVKGFDERADLAAARLIEFLKKWIKGSEKGSNDPMYQLGMTLLERNKDGDLDYKSISKLYSLEAQFNDPEYSEIMQLFKESNVVERTALNFYFYEKTELGVWRKLEPSFNRM